MEINKTYLREFLKENDLTASEASEMLGQSVNYIGRILDPKRHNFRETLVNKLVNGLGLSREMLLSNKEFIETKTGKLLPKPENDIFTKKIEQSPEVAAAARAVDSNGERLKFDDRMKLYRSKEVIATDPEIIEDSEPNGWGVRMTPVEPKKTIAIHNEMEDFASRLREERAMRFEKAYRYIVDVIVDTFKNNPTSVPLGIISSIQEASDKFAIS